MRRDDRDWRTLRHVGRPRIEPRVPAAAEQAFATDADRKREAVRRAHEIEVERQVERIEEALAGLWQILGRVDRAAYRRLDSVRRDLRWLKRTYGPVD